MPSTRPGWSKTSTGLFLALMTAQIHWLLESASPNAAGIFELHGKFGTLHLFFEQFWKVPIAHKRIQTQHGSSGLGRHEMGIPAPGLRPFNSRPGTMHERHNKRASVP